MKNNKIKKLISTFLVINLTFLANAQFNENLNNNDKKILEDGKTLIKNTSYKKMSLAADSDIKKELINEIKTLKPYYFAEIIKVFSVEEYPNFLETIENMLIDIPSYAGIPYYSVQHKKWFDLYDSAKVISINENENSKLIDADLVMKPFGLIKTQITTKKGEDYYYYKSTNLSNLKYQNKITCASKGDMKSIILVSKENDKWIMYAVSAVDAPNIIFLKNRIETSFINRIKTFCTYFFEKI